MEVAWLGALFEVDGDGDGLDLEATHTTVGVALSIFGICVVLINEIDFALVPWVANACVLQCWLGGSRLVELILLLKQMTEQGLTQSLWFSSLFLEHPHVGTLIVSWLEVPNQPHSFSH